MTQDEIIEMAKEAGLINQYGGRETALTELIENFSKLVEDKTRRELREEIIYTWVPPHFVDLAVKEEREACAKFFDDNDTLMFWGSQAATHIRARSGDQK